MTACIDGDRKKREKEDGVQGYRRGGSYTLCSSQVGPLSPRIARWLGERKFTLSQDSNTPYQFNLQTTLRESHSRHGPIY